MRASELGVYLKCKKFVNFDSNTCHANYMCTTDRLWSEIVLQPLSTIIVASFSHAVTMFWFKLTLQHKYSLDT